MIPIYSAEVSDGIAEAVASQNSIAYISPILSSPENLKKQLVTAKVLQDLQLAIGNDVTFDLYPIHTILVTTGWNKNDDIFDRYETWASRFTPEDKPFNIGHNPREIIGHITANTVIDDDLNVVASDLAFDEVPDKFHILTSAVVYRHVNSRDEALEAEAAAMIESIQNGEQFVSMECLFGNFDYGLTYAGGEQEVVERNQSTAFLTKHLRRHGGCGEYNGGKLGRVLKNITFSGKGLVENPANPESIIFNDTEQFRGVFASVLPKQEQNTTTLTQGDASMAETQDKYAEKLEAQVKELQSDLAAANAKIETLGEAQVKSQLAEKDVAIAKLTEQVEASDTKIEELTASYNDAVKARETAEAEKAEVDEKLAEATEKITEVEAKEKTTARVALLVDKGVEHEEATAVAAEFDSLDDEKFASIVELKAAVAAGGKRPNNLEVPNEEEGDTKKKKAKADAEGEEETADPDGEAAADDADLDNSVPDEDPALGSDEENNEQDELMQSLAGFLDTTMHGSKASE